MVVSVYGRTFGTRVPRYEELYDPASYENKIRRCDKLAKVSGEN